MRIKAKVEIEETVDIQCDVCHKSCRNLESTCQNVEYATLKAMWGFDSEKDQQIHETHLCEKCYDKVVELIRQLGGNVGIKHYDPWSSISPDQQDD